MKFSVPFELKNQPDISKAILPIYLNINVCKDFSCQVMMELSQYLLRIVYKQLERLGFVLC
jgi:hypothetical protein